MKTNLLICFLFFSVIAFGKEDREIIKEIDKINSSALSLYNNKEIVKSFKEFINAKQLSDSIQDPYGSAMANFHLGDIYYLMENYKSAKEYYLLTLRAAEKINDTYLTASSYLNLAKIYKEEKDFTKSIEYFKKALNSSLTSNQLDYAETKLINHVNFDARIHLSELYIDNLNLEQALINLLKIRELIDTNEFDLNTEGYYNFIYGLYFARKELYNNANAKFKKALVLLEAEKEDLDYELLCDIYMQMSVSLAKSGNSTEAYLALLEHNKYKDELFNSEKQNQELITKANFEIEDYKANAEKANAEALQQKEITNNIKKVNVVIFITLLLLFVSLIAIYISYVSKRQLSKTLKEKNGELEQAKNEALKTAELKTKFISNVSHELRTPLYGVVGITSLLLDNGNFNKRDTKYLKSLKYSGDYLLNLINDILQVGKMEANKIELQNVSVNLKRLLEDMVHSFDYRLEETNNKLNLIIDNYVPEIIKCDKVRLSQILINLVGNSIKFTSNGEINLRVRLLSLEGSKVGLRFEVQDNGAGIPKDKFDTIFENFSQLEDSNINYQGTGLGLSITKNLIELFESKINLESEVGVGTTFSFEVDFEIDKDAAKAVSDYKKSKNKIETQISNENYDILVAEDNKINQVVTKNLLQKNGYTCTVVQNGKEALDAVKCKKYDLVLMDINMPIMNGNEATESIREFDIDLPIIALTAADIEEVGHNFRTIGYNDIITKPFDNYEFFQKINSNIQNSTNNKNGSSLSLVS